MHENITITQTVTKYEKDGRQWREVSTETKSLTHEQYELTTSKDTLAWFRNLGSRQVCKATYTAAGYCITQVASYSPCRTEKNVRRFSFDYDRSN